MSEDNKTRIIRRSARIEKVIFNQHREVSKTPDADGISFQNQSDEKTVLYRSNNSEDSKENITSADPVVGWLVVTKGLGKGHSFEIGEGNNSVGRDKSQKISLDFGDMSISRENHFKILYEPKSRKFYVMLGESRNITYLNDNIFGIAEIKNFDRITLGDTELTFIGFCGENFSW